MYNAQDNSQISKFFDVLIELNSIKEHDLIIHNQHGIGKFISVTHLVIGNKKNDYLKLEYLDNDILYLPVENIDKIKKYGSFDVDLDKLGNNSFARRRAKIKEDIYSMAHYIVNIAAKRFVSKSENIVDTDMDLYQKFCDAFPYKETKDQLHAIKDVENDIFSGNLMDRMICGDVGFGKTEVAMRAMATFALSKSKVQSCMIAPTTVLAKQHYENMVKRFDGFNVKISEFSRFVTKSQIKISKEALKSGEIDIAIGTHALLSKDVEFKNLGLIIIDEEQSFGVTQKEKLKSVKNSVNSLIMSATPIPRSLQMSLSGIKDLSIISTPPVDRIAIKTFVGEYDIKIIVDAIRSEKQRNGLIFYVVPKIEFIEHALNKISSILFDIKIGVAHGKMKSNEINKVLTDFKDKKIDLLLSTNIIGSGIDIKEANTIIVDNAELFGLGQLYQLKGRVGRSNSQGYAYILTSQKDYAKSDDISKKLEVLESASKLGSGFAIANHDMDIRGFGNLVGKDQSGKIKEIGIELYHTMLQSAIQDIKSNSDTSYESTNAFEIEDPELNLGMSIYIPDEYIEDPTKKMNIYRKIANIKNIESLSEFEDNLRTMFGEIPTGLNNLFEIKKLKVICAEIGILSVDSNSSGFVFKFQDAKKYLILNYLSKNAGTSIQKSSTQLLVQTKDKTNVINSLFLILKNIRDLIEPLQS